MQKHIVLALVGLAALQGCVVPAAIQATKQWDEYDLVLLRQNEPQHFTVIIRVDHKRGAFDPLGGHGRTSVTRSVDFEFWRLFTTQNGIKTKKEGVLEFDSEEDALKWRQRIADIPADKVGPWRVIESGGFRMSADRELVQGSFNGRDCTVPLPPAPTAPYSSRRLVVSESGDHVMVLDRTEGVINALILDACDANAPKRPVHSPIWLTAGFSTMADGTPRVIRGRRENLKAHPGERWTYEVQLYPGPKSLTFNQNGLGLGREFWLAPRDFVFEEHARRFHWIVMPPSIGEPRFSFVTHDFITDKTTVGVFSFEES